LNGGNDRSKPAAPSNSDSFAFARAIDKFEEFLFRFK
jgi:hypothetical protein